MDTNSVDNVGVYVEEAYENIKAKIWKTPLMFSPYLSSEGGASVYLKLGLLF